MSDTPEGEKAPDQETGPTKDTPKAGSVTFTAEQQEHINSLLAAQKSKARPSDYDDLKAKAAKFDELEEQSKTELQKAMDRAEKAEQSLAAEQVAGLRWRVAAKHGISDEDAELFLTGKDEDSLTKQAQRLADRAAAQRHPDPHQGRDRAGAPVSAADQFANFANNL